MKILVWSVFVFAVLLWTGVAVISAQAIEWASQRLLADAPAALETATGNIVIPPMISPLLEPAAWATLFQTVQSALASTAAAIPLLRSMLDWLVPLVWIVWGLGAVALLALAIGITVLLNRYYSFERLAR